MPGGLDQVGDGLLWDWEPDAHEGTCWRQDQDVSDFVEGSSLILFWTSSHEEVEAEKSDVPDNDLIELVRRNIGLEDIPKHNICVKKYYMRQAKGFIYGS
jgi:hypothetical protein